MPHDVGDKRNRFQSAALSTRWPPSRLFTRRGIRYAARPSFPTRLSMFPKPQAALSPNTYAYESEPMVKATGFREYDARWLFGKEINLMGIQALGMGLGALISELGPEAGDRHRPRFPRLFGLDQVRADLRPDGVRLQGARHRACDDADGLFRAVRTRRALRRDGDGLAQRQWLDRREDGRQPPADLRPGRDDAAEGDRARRRVRQQGRRLLSVSREFSGALHRRSDQAAETEAQASRWWWPAATAPPARSRRRCWRRSAAR